MRAHGLTAGSTHRSALSKTSKDGCTVDLRDTLTFRLSVLDDLEPRTDHLSRMACETHARKFAGGENLAFKFMLCKGVIGIPGRGWISVV